MKCMVFEPSISGHVLEWLHHLYCFAQSLDDEFVFVVPQKFEEEKKRLSWPQGENVKVVYLEGEEEKKCNKGGLLLKALNTSFVIRKYLRQERANEVLLIFLMKVMPFLPFILPKGSVASGVLYRIYLYDKEKRGLRLFLEKTRYFIMSRSPKIKRILVLNDVNVIEKFNLLYHTEKFCYIPDPFPIIKGPFHNLREELGIPKKNKVFFQFGTIDDRKNSIQILDACSLMSDKELADKTFVFSGRIDSKIREIFLERMNLLRLRVQIILMEGFLSYEQLNDLCYTSDCLLTLYTNVNQSSGTIGYASFFEKYVIGPSYGLLGNLIKSNSLGITLDTITPETIRMALNETGRASSKKYCVDHSVESFCKVFLK